MNLLRVLCTVSFLFILVSSNCPQGYVLYGSICAECLPFCTSCSSLYYCTSCEQGYTLQTKDPTTSFCMSQVCPGGQYYNMQSKECQSNCPTGCASCNPFNLSYCLACSQGYYFDDDKNTCYAYGPYRITTLTFTVLIFVLLLIKIILDSVMKLRAKKSGMYHSIL